MKAATQTDDFKSYFTIYDKQTDTLAGSVDYNTHSEAAVELLRFQRDVALDNITYNLNNNGVRFCVSGKQVCGTFVSKYYKTEPAAIAASKGFINRVKRIKL